MASEANEAVVPSQRVVDDAIASRNDFDPLKVKETVSSRGGPLVQQAFDAFVTHMGRKSHTVTIPELGAALHDLNVPVPNDELRDVVRASTISSSTQIDFYEFYSLFLGTTIFYKLANGKGAHLLPQDLQSSLEEAGFTPSMAEVQAMIEKASSGDNKGLLSIQDFLTIYLADYENTFHPHPLPFLTTWWRSSREAIPKSQELTDSQDFIAGTAAGVAITLVGHPFDTIKVRLQTCPPGQFNGLFDCIAQTIRKEGFFGLYKGMGSPLATVPVINAVVFASYGSAKRFLTEENKEITTFQLLLAASWAGFVNSFVVGPVELIKTRLQVQYGKTVAKELYRGPMDCMSQILREQGPRGLFMGMSSTIYREVPAYAAQFYAYESIRKMMIRPGQTEDDLKPYQLMFAGGIAGISAWVVSYPLDVIKSKLQAEPHNKPSKYKQVLPFDGRIIDAYKQIVKANGWRGLWRGFIPCVARAFPSNATGFLAYEYVSSRLRNAW